MNDENTVDSVLPPSPQGDRSGLYLGILVLYVIVLALGTFGELFDIQWILDLPIY